jgi:DNA-binding NtrC family response regulator
MLKYEILLVDDEEENLSTTRDILRRWGYSVDTATNGDDAIETVRGSHKDYAVALLDYKMPGKNGAEVAQEIRKLNDDIVIIMYSAYPSVESLRATIRAGSVNFIEKTEDLNYLRTAIAEACAEFERFRKSKPVLTDDVVRKLISSVGMIGVAESMARVAEKVHKFKISNKPALVLGETGSGKEMIAKALHNGKDDTFFVVNCAAFQNSGLVESELFGHEKGAFTGATSRKIGILEAARGGTVYLDELHYLDMQTQGKLLRAIREKKIRRVGGVREESVEFRLVASSWPNIEERVAKGTFLPDLYYRLKFLCIEIPPLRERPEDIEPLVHFFCEKHFKETGQRKEFLKRTIRRLEKYSWPGNVGELDGCISGLLTESTKAEIDESQLDSQFLVDGPPEVETTMDKFEDRYGREKRKLILYTITKFKSVQRAADHLGMKASSLHTMLTRMGLRDELKGLNLET